MSKLVTDADPSWVVRNTIVVARASTTKLASNLVVAMYGEQQQQNGVIPVVAHCLSSIMDAALQPRQVQFYSVQYQ